MLITKTQKINSIFSVAIFLTTLLPWFGFGRGVQEIQGIWLLGNPLMLLFILAIVASLCLSNGTMAHLSALIGFGGVVCLEVYAFFTWHILTITGAFSVSTSVAGAYPEFYIAFCVACIPVVFNGVVLLNKKLSKENTL